MQCTKNHHQPLFSTEHLPLSWIRCAIARPVLPAISLTLSGSQWIQNGAVPWEMSLEELYSSELTRFRKGFVIRGCSPSIQQFFSQQGCECILTGSEAVLSLDKVNHFKKSVQELRKRGLRWGRVMEITLHPNASHIFRQLQQQSIHSREPQLRHLFRVSWEKTGRYFVFTTFSGNILAGISLSRESHGGWHTELILRKAQTPVGVMEALILEVYQHLQKEGYSSLSLGEVPFYRKQAPDHWKSKMFFRIGHLLRFAYPYHGLFRFKNKFTPEWRPLYLCSNRPITWRMLLDLYIRSGYLRLTLFKLGKWASSQPLLKNS